MVSVPIDIHYIDEKMELKAIFLYCVIQKKVIRFGMTLSVST